MDQTAASARYIDETNFFLNCFNDDGGGGNKSYVILEISFPPPRILYTAILYWHKIRRRLCINTYTMTTTRYSRNQSTFFAIIYAITANMCSLDVKITYARYMVHAWRVLEVMKLNKISLKSWTMKHKMFLKPVGKTQRVFVNMFFSVLHKLQCANCNVSNNNNMITSSHCCTHPIRTVIGVPLYNNWRACCNEISSLFGSWLFHVLIIFMEKNNNFFGGKSAIIPINWN